MSERKVLTIGTFDLPHMGHAYLFKESERLGELTVGVNSDEFVEAYKGKKPEYNYKERAEVVAALGYRVIKNSTAGRDLIMKVKPHYITVGSDWARKDYYAQIDVDHDFMDAMGTTMVYIPRVTPLSSTQLRGRLGRDQPSH